MKLGQKHTKESRLLISAHNKAGTLEMREKMREIAIKNGNRPPIFRQHSLESKRKISETNKRINRHPPIVYGAEHSRWKGGKSKCLKCDKVLTNYVAKHCRTHQEYPSGDRSHLWRGGIAFRKKQDLRNDSAYQGWVDAVKKRDKGLCRLQNGNCFGYKVVHHILPWRDYPEERYNINNGITLCQYHHPRKRVDEQRLIPTLRELVTSNIQLF